MLWNKWYVVLHVNCNCIEIKSKKEVEQYINSVKNVLKITMNKSIELNAHKYISDFEEEMKMFSNSLSMIESKVSLFFCWEYYK